MPAQTSMLHVRIDDEPKAQAIQVLDEMGLSVADSVRLFFRRVVIDQAFPLEGKASKAKTCAAMAEADKIARMRRARFAAADALLADLENNRRK